MHEDCARWLRIWGARTWLLLMAAAGCSQDWSLPPIQSLDGGSVTDGGTLTPTTGSQQSGTSVIKDAGSPDADRPSTGATAGKGGAGGSSPTAGASAAAGAGGANTPSKPDAGAAQGGGAAPSNKPDSGAPAAEPCAAAGSMRCAGEAGQREICQGGVFKATTACKADEVCEDAGTCVKVAAICQGSASSNVCDGQGGLVTCAANGSVVSQESCMSERHCQVGIATGRCPKCIPNEYRCDGASLQQCDKDGQAFNVAMTCESAALCKAESGACTDAACAADRFSCMRDTLMQCNDEQTAFEKVLDCQPGLCDATRGACLACSAGSRSCDPDGRTALVCNATGESLARNACTAPRSHCVGAGQCVECAVDIPCPQSTEVCRTSTCNLRTGSCESTRVTSGTSCALAGKSGVCDTAGACVECLTEGDGRCAGAAPHCTTAHTCVRCTEDSHCGFGEKCVNAACVSKCGDGVLDPGEDCERGYLNSSPSNCDFATCKRTNYINCRDTSVICPAGTVCLASFYCTPRSDNNCVTSCPEVPGFKVGCSTSICYIDCTNGGSCPSDMECTEATPDGTNVTMMCFGKVP